MRFVELAVGFFLVAGCAETSAALPTETIAIDTRHGQVKIKVEIAADRKSQEHGLMFRRAISSIEPNAPPMSTSPIPSIEPIVAVIELNGRRAHDLDIQPGDTVHASMFTSRVHN
jgi:uncharacterized membrane protein (UPF0127 family)